MASEVSRPPVRALRIGVDARLVTYRRGIGTYVHHLIQEFAVRDDPHEFILYVDQSRAVMELPSHPRFKVVVLKPRFYPVWEQALLASRARYDDVDVLHCPANTGPLISLGRTRLILTIHDVMYLMPHAMLPASPSVYQRLGRVYRGAIVPRAARRASRIITVSNQSAQDIRHYLKLSSTPVDVIPEAPNSRCRVLVDSSDVMRRCAGLGILRPFVLAPGALDPRKNTQRVLSAFERAHATLGENMQLVLFGLTPSGIKWFRSMADSLGMGERVCLLGFVTEEDLVALYNGCRVFLYPSLYEGFGLPLLEAMACGAAVATSHAGSLPEIGGDAAEYADPLDINSISAALLRANDARNEVRRGKGLSRAQSFTWRVAAARTIGSYEETGA
jgi:glycosyltransferase involved in cell wall biosynthesis